MEKTVKKNPAPTVCVFCGSNPAIADPYVSATAELGSCLAAAGFGLVFGGYDTGLMGVIAHSMADEGASVIGVFPETIECKGGRNKFPCTESIMTDDLSERKEAMGRLADAFVAAPGGVGTLDELYGVIAEQKLVAPESRKRIAVYNVDGCYDALFALHDDLARGNLMPKADQDLFFVSSDPGDIASYLSSAR